MNLEEMKKRKKELGYSYEQISTLSGVPLGTVQKVFSGVTSSPRYDTLLALEKVFSGPEPSLLREPAAVYGAKKQGEYTLEDYYKIPDEQRVELIDGVIYDMSAPTSVHQIITGLLYAKLLSHITSKGGTCLPMLSPLDVQLDCDNRTMVQPDVVVVCDRSKVIKRCVYGAPDLCIEILSPSTRKKDMVIKLNKYMNAGVKEYWLIDPDKKTVVVYDFAHDNLLQIYGFSDKIPLRLWEDDCRIDFKEIYDYVSFLYEPEKPETD